MLDIHLDDAVLRAGLLNAQAALKRFAKHQATFMGKAYRRATPEITKTLRRHLEECHRGRR